MKKIIDRYQKFRTLERILEGHSDAFENRPEILEMKATFTAKLDQIENLISRLRLPVNDIYQHRMDTRQKYRETLQSMIAITMHFAAKENNKPMIKLLASYKAKAIRGNSYSLYDTGVNVLQIISDNLTLMQGLGLTEAQYNTYSAELQNYNASLQDANFDLNNRRKLRDDLEKAANECEKIVKGRIDTFVEHTANLFPALNQEYRLARFRKRLRRKPGDPDIGTADISGTVIDSVTNQPLQNATVSIAALGLVTETDEDGVFLFDELPEGNLHVTCHLNGFQTPDPLTVTLKKGESIRHDFMLTPVAINNAG